MFLGQVSLQALGLLNTWVSTKLGFHFHFFFAWEKVLTLDNVKKRGKALANRCFLCGKEEETIDHLLVHCLKVNWCGIFF